MGRVLEGAWWVFDCWGMICPLRQTAKNHNTKNMLVLSGTKASETPNYSSSNSRKTFCAIWSILLTSMICGQLRFKKSLWSFARVVRQDHVNRARNTDQAARTRETFLYLAVKITRFYVYQTWPGTCLRNSRGYMGFFSWLCFSGWMEFLSHVFVVS